jgi:hypothetical protein
MGPVVSSLPGPAVSRFGSIDGHGDVISQPHGTYLAMRRNCFSLLKKRST